MARRKIYTYRDEVLRTKGAPVTDFTGEIRQLVEDMLETLHIAPGIGLAACQVGVAKRVIVVDVSDEGNQPIAIINPEIVEQEGIIRSEEGCLSIPDFRDTIQRNAAVLVKGYDVNGKEFELEADGLLSRCLQHEIDHLDGILFIDHLSRIKKEMFKRWDKKQEFET